MTNVIKKGRMYITTITKGEYRLPGCLTLKEQSFICSNNISFSILVIEHLLRVCDKKESLLPTVRSFCDPFRMFNTLLREESG